MSCRSYTFKSANAHEHTHSKCQRFNLLQSAFIARKIKEELIIKFCI